MATATKPPSTATETAVDEGSSSSIYTIHPDIIRHHILTRLDGPALASTACTSTELNSLAWQEDLWASICSSTWPSTNTTCLRQVISSFPNGPRSFFSRVFPLPLSSTNSSTGLIILDRPSELISAVDIFYRNNLIFNKVVETETVSGWFRCSPFRIDMLDPKDTCPTPIPHLDTEETCRELAEDLSLSWILIDPAGPRAMNLSSHRPVSVQKHWLSGEVHARFAAVLAGERGSGSSSEFVQCAIVVSYGGRAQGSVMHVTGVSLQVEDVDGMFLNGRDSLEILHRGFEGKRGISGRREEEGKRKYEEFLEMKRERKERKLRTEGMLDMLCVAFGVLIFTSFGLFVLLR